MKLIKKLQALIGLLRRAFFNAPKCAHENRTTTFSGRYVCHDCGFDSGKEVI